MITETAVESDESHSSDRTQGSLYNKVANARRAHNAPGWHPRG